MVTLLLICSLIIGLVGGTGNRTAWASENDNFKEQQVNTFDEEELNVGFRVTSLWNHHYNAEITITNQSVEPVNNWEIKFSYQDTIENIWNARITSQGEGEYVIHNADWNQDIEPGESVTFGMTVVYEDEINVPKDCFLTREWQEVEGDYDVEFREHSRYDNQVNGQIIITNNTDERIGFIATYKDEVKLEKFTLLEMGKVDYDEEDFEEDEKVIYDADYFECYDDYIEYLVSEGKITEEEADEALVNAQDDVEDTESLPFSVDGKRMFSRKGGKAPVLTPTPFATINIGQDNKAIQNFLIDGKNMYITQHTGKKSSNVNVAKLTGNETGTSYAFPNKNYVAGDMLDFAHGQTLEKAGEYFLTVGNCGRKRFGRQLCFVREDVFSKLSEGGELRYIDWKKGNNGSPFEKLTKVGYANSAGERTGDVLRADAAVTEDESTLAIWCRTKNEKLQLSLYDYSVIKKYLLDSKATGISFNGKYKAELKRACFVSCTLECPKGTDSVLQPLSSLQGIDVYRIATGKWYVFLTGGNQYSKEKGKKNKLQISRIMLTKGENNKVNNTKRVTIRPNQKSSSGYWEIEGCHVKGSQLQFLITPSKKGANKQNQYLASVHTDLRG